MESEERIITTPTEEDYKELERLSRKLKLPSMACHYHVIGADKDGKITGEDKGRSHTWNRNYWNMVYMQSCMQVAVATNFGAGYMSLKRHNATVSAITWSTGVNLYPLGAVSNSDYGLLAGRGSGAESFEGYEFTTPITHGSGANQLSHRAQDATTGVWTGGSLLWTATLRRVLDNLSGGSIVVTEVGIKYYYSSSSYYYLMCRDLLGSSVTVLNAGTLTIVYTMTLTFPE